MLGRLVVALFFLAVLPSQGYGAGGEVLWSMQTGTVKDVDIAPKGNVIAVGTGEGVLSLDENGDILWKADILGVKAVAASMAGRRVLAGSENSVLLLDGEGSVLWKKNFQWPVRDLDLSADAGRAAILAEDGVHMLNSTGDQVWTYRTWYAREVSMSPYLGYTAVRTQGEILFLNEDGEVLWEYKEGGVNGIDVTAVTAEVAAGSDKGILLLNKEGAATQSFEAGNVEAVSASGRFAAGTMGTEVLLLDRTSEVRNYSYAVRAVDVAVSPDGEYLAVGESGAVTLLRNPILLAEKDMARASSIIANARGLEGDVEEAWAQLILARNAFADGRLNDAASYTAKADELAALAVAEVRQERALDAIAAAEKAVQEGDLIGADTQDAVEALEAAKATYREGRFTEASAAAEGALQLAESSARRVMQRGADQAFAEAEKAIAEAVSVGAETSAAAKALEAGRGAYEKGEYSGAGARAQEALRLALDAKAGKARTDRLKSGAAFLLLLGALGAGGMMYKRRRDEEVEIKKRIAALSLELSSPEQVAGETGAPLAVVEPYSAFLRSHSELAVEVKAAAERLEGMDVETGGEKAALDALSEELEGMMGRYSEGMLGDAEHGLSRARAGLEEVNGRINDLDEAQKQLRKAMVDLTEEAAQLKKELRKVEKAGIFVADISDGLRELLERAADTKASSAADAQGTASRMLEKLKELSQQLKERPKVFESYREKVEALRSESEELIKEFAALGKDARNEKKWVGEIMERLNEAEDAIKSGSFEKSEEDLQEISNAISESKKSLEEKQELAKRWPEWEQRIMVLLDGWGRVTPDMLTDVPEKWHAYTLRRYLEEHPEEPLSIDLNELRYHGDCEETLRELEEEAKRIPRLIPTVRKTMTVDEEKRLLSEIREDLGDAWKAYKERDFDACRGKLDAIRDEIETCISSLEDKKSAGKSWSDWSQRIRVLVEGWEKVTPDMLADIPEKWREYALGRYLEEHQEEPLSLEDGELRLHTQLGDDLQEAKERMREVSRAMKKIKDMDLKAEEVEHEECTASLKKAEKAFKEKRFQESRRLLAAVNKSLDGVEGEIEEKRAVSEAWPEWSQRIKGIIHETCRVTYDMVPEIPERWREYAFWRYLHEHRNTPVILQNNVLKCPRMMAKITASEERDREFPDLSTEEARFYRYVESRGGSYSRSQASLDLGLKAADVFRLEDALVDKGYIDID